jgi:hypothetical protein
MNPKWKLGVLFLLSALAPLWPASAERNGAAQEPGPDYKNNNCVSRGSGPNESGRKSGISLRQKLPTPVRRKR